MKLLQHLTLIFCLLILTACSSRQQQPDNTNWRQQREKLESVTHWTISGKLAIITPEKKARYVFAGSRMVMTIILT